MRRTTNRPERAPCKAPNGATRASEGIRLMDGVRLRCEHFGGLAFDGRTGNTIDLDRGAFRLLELADTPTGIRLRDAVETIGAERIDRQLRDREVDRVVESVMALGLVEECDPAQDARPAVPRRERPWPSGSLLTAPEAVHWAITWRCDADCRDCYAARHRRLEVAELPTDQALRLVDRVAEWGVFQLAIGGGEPLLREDLPRVVRHARERGLLVHVTTGGEVPEGLNDGLLESVTSVQIGVRHEDLLRSPPSGHVGRLADLRRRVEDAGAQIGANLVLCRTVVHRFEEAVERLVDAGYRRVTLLRYKPPDEVQRWIAESPKPGELRGMEARIARLVDGVPELAMRLDCALAFLERRLPPDEARRAGLRGCVAGSRIVALGPDGSVYPCSQLVDRRFRVGHLLGDDPAAVWRESAALRRCRDRRAQRGFRQTLCGACRAVDQCGGCLAMSDDGLGSDPGCPEPLLPPLDALGRDGRVAELARFFESHRSISVGEYMERYGVDQKRAVSELRRFPGLVLARAAGDRSRRSIGRRKADRYEWLVEDVVGDIQDSIGATSGGFPYATREQIVASIELDGTEAGYPRWLRDATSNPAVEDEARASAPGEDMSASRARRRRR